jgi:hypothetical protein
MSTPMGVIIRFDGDPDDLIDRFERARRLWIDAQGDDYNPPEFYAACTLRQHQRGGPRAHQTGTGIVVITAWATEADHKAFTHRLRPHLDAVGLAMPDRLEHLPIEKLGWD